MTNKISKTVVLILVCLLGFIIISDVINKHIYPLKWDAFGYYLYLPLTFIYNDLGMSDFSIVKDLMAKYEISTSFYQGHIAPTGSWIILYTMGQAILFSPFFFIAHFYTLATGGLADGFSYNYQVAIVLGCFIYTIIGLFVLRKVLLRFFSDRITALVLILLVFATNYTHIVLRNIDMSHNQLFFFYTLILWFTIQWHETYKCKYVIFLAICSGFVILCRPTEMVLLLIPLLWNVYDKETLKAKFRLLLSKKKQIITFVIILFCIGLPQFIYWKIYAGSLFYKSYNNPAEGLDIFCPHTANFLFSFRKGWYVYTPIMILATLGFVSMYKRNRKVFCVLFIYFIVNLYIVSSWTLWWFGTSFSQRAMVQSYPVMIIALGYFILAIKEHKIITKIVAGILITGVAILNLFQMWQVDCGILDGSRMTFAYYCKIFGKTHVNEEDQKLLEFERPVSSIAYQLDTANYNYKFVKELSFEGMGDSNQASLNFLRMDFPDMYSPHISVRYKDLSKKDYVWVKVSVQIYPLGDMNKTEGSLVATFEYRGDAYGYSALSLTDLEDVQPNRWNEISYYYITPYLRRKTDKLKVYYWNRSNEPVLVNNLKVEYYEPKH